MWGPAIIAGAAGAACTVIWFGDPTNPDGHLPTCPTKLLFNLTCPGCGSMRAIYSLMHGDMLGALYYNAVGVIAIALLIVAFGIYCARLWTGRQIRSWQNFRYAPLTALVIVGTWFVIRNIPIEPLWRLHV